MAKQSVPLTSEIKTRIPDAWLTHLERMAVQEQTGVSYIVRRALSEFMARRGRTKKAA